VVSGAIAAKAGNGPDDTADVEPPATCGLHAAAANEFPGIAVGKLGPSMISTVSPAWPHPRAVDRRIITYQHCLDYFSSGAQYMYSED
jgi:hypothetical protein